jgi:pyridoxamine 5'-phosphate oxidase
VFRVPISGSYTLQNETRLMAKIADARTVLRGLAALSGQYPAFVVADAAGSPTDQFSDWLDVAIKAGVPEPHAMTLSTIDSQGCPDARVLLLKDLDDGGWYFAANSLSPKGKQIQQHSDVALSFYWPELGRQVRVKGQAINLGSESSAEDFLARSLGSRATALVGHQSEILRDPTELDGLFQAQLQRLTDSPSLVEDAWAVYVVRAREVEFWQGAADRRHLRLRYRQEQSEWRKELLWP